MRQNGFYFLAFRVFLAMGDKCQLGKRCPNAMADQPVSHAASTAAGCHLSGNGLHEVVELMTTDRWSAIFDGMKMDRQSAAELQEPL